MSPPLVRVLEAEELHEAAGVAARALQDAPTTVASHGDDPVVRMERTHPTFVSLFASARTPQVGALCGSCPIAVAVATEPGRCVGALFRPFAAQTLALPAPEMGDPQREQVFWANWAVHDIEEEHWHIGPVGVEPGFQGRGIGGAVMRELCARFDRDRHLAWLETDKEINVRFYTRLGFEVAEHSVILGVPTWYMRREPLPRG